MQIKNGRVALGQPSRDLFLSRLDGLSGKHPIAKLAAKHVGENFLVSRKENLDALKVRAESQSRWQHLNDEGKRAVRRESLKAPFVDFAKSKLALKALRDTLSTTLPKVRGRESTDMVGELRDQEIRRMVREWPQEKRDRLNMSPEVALAVARAPAELSGVSPGVHEQIRSQILEAERPGEVEAWRAADEALQVADEALKEVERDLYAGAEFAHDGEYQQFVEQHVRPEVQDKRA